MGGDAQEPLRQNDSSRCIEDPPPLFQPIHIPVSPREQEAEPTIVEEVEYSPMSRDEDADDGAMDVDKAPGGDVDMGLLEDLKRSCGSEHKAAKFVDDCNHDILGLVLALGSGSTTAYRRERQGALNRIVSEVYSPPRVTAAIKMLPSLKLIPGLAMDLTTLDDEGKPWDFTTRRSTVKARRQCERQKPALIVGCGMH